LGCAGVFVRPDFYPQGGAQDGEDLDRLIGDWRRHVEGAKEHGAPAEFVDNKQA
jgi:hypothetical protein